jgi:hypothetical protein
MALKKSITMSGDAKVEINGVTSVVPSYSYTFNDMYIKVVSVSGGKENIKSHVGFFTEGKFSFSRSYEFSPSMDAGNFIKQTYDHLKTLEEFSGAVDC